MLVDIEADHMPKLLSDEFRDRAEQDRLAAARTSTPTERRALLEAAEQWERLAGQWETWAALGFANQHVQGSPVGQCHNVTTGQNAGLVP